MQKHHTASGILTLPTLIGGGLTLAAALLMGLSVGSALPAIHALRAEAILPPVWLMSLLWLSSFALLGGALGYLLSCPSGGALREARLWRGATFLVLTVTLALVWYSLLFGKLLLLPSWLCLLLAAAASLTCALSWWPISRGAALIAGGCSLWQLSLFFWQFAIIIHN